MEGRYRTIITIQEGLYKNIDPVFVVDIRYPDTTISGAHLFTTFEQALKFVKDFHNKREKKKRKLLLMKKGKSVNKTKSN